SERPGARQQEVDGEPDDDGRQSHQCIEDDDHRLAAGKADQRDGGAKRHADESAENDRRQADDERQPHDRKQRRIAGRAAVEAPKRRPAWGLHLVGSMLHSGKKSSIFVTGSYSFMAVHMQDLLTTDEAASYLRLSERKLYELVANGAVP